MFASLKNVWLSLIYFFRLVTRVCFFSILIHSLLEVDVVDAYPIPYRYRDSNNDPKKNIYIQKNEDSTHKDRWIWRRLNGDGGNRIEWKKKRNLLPEERRRRLTSGVDLTVWMWMREKYIYIFYPLFLELKRDIIWDESVFWDKTEKLSFFSSHFSYVISFY